ncbi:unnamed protein product, partial [Urochloa humidicola]
LRFRAAVTHSIQFPTHKSSPLSSSSSLLHDPQHRRGGISGQAPRQRLRWVPGWAARSLTAVSFRSSPRGFSSRPTRCASADTAARLVHLLAFATAWGAGSGSGSPCRRHRNVQVLAEAPIWESTGKDVPDILRFDISEFCYICGSIRLPAPLEESINHLPAWVKYFIHGLGTYPIPYLHCKGQDLRLVFKAPVTVQF